MRTIIGNRGSGKTTELIEMSLKNRETIVCRDSKTKADIMKIMEMKGLCFLSEIEQKILEPITYEDFIGRKFRGRHDYIGLLIDDLDDFLLYMTRGIQIKGASFTKSGIIKIL